MFDDFTDAANVGDSGSGVGVDYAEAEIGLEESVHHDAVTKLEDLERKDGAGEENQGEREQGKFNHIV